MLRAIPRSDAAANVLKISSKRLSPANLSAKNANRSRLFCRPACFGCQSDIGPIKRFIGRAGVSCVRRPLRRDADRHQLPASSRSELACGRLLPSMDGCLMLSDRCSVFYPRMATPSPNSACFRRCHRSDVYHCSGIWCFSPMLFVLQIG